MVYEKQAVIGDQEVIVFLARPESIAEPSRRAAALACLPPDDRAHAERFHFERDRDIALASRTVQREALSACARVQVEPSAWRFLADPRGRPEVAAPLLTPRLRFNVANTAGLVACVVTLGRDVGVDVEPERNDVPEELFTRCFTSSERADLSALPPAARPRRFIELWTIKEAYLKARGLGLEPPLEHISVVIGPASPRLVLHPSLGDSADDWMIELWSPTPSHCAALCVRRSIDALTIRRRWMIWDPVCSRFLPSSDAE